MNKSPKWEVLPRRRSEVRLLLASYFFGTSFQESAQVIDHQYRSAPIRFFLTDHQGGNHSTGDSAGSRLYRLPHPSDVAQFRLAGGPIGVLAAANEELFRNDILVNILGFWHDLPCPRYYLPLGHGRGVYDYPAARRETP